MSFITLSLVLHRYYHRSQIIISKFCTGSNVNARRLLIKLFYSEENDHQQLIIRKIHI
jgi:hypothetical protein